MQCKSPDRTRWTSWWAMLLSVQWVGTLVSCSPQEPEALLLVVRYPGMKGEA